MELRQIRSFCTIAEKGSFTFAARVLLLSQPALGLQIRNLEDELGVRLLHRHSRGTSLTQEGTLFLQHARSILAQVEAARREVGRSTRSTRAHIRLGLAPSLAALLAMAIEQRAQLDEVDIELAEAPTTVLNDWITSGQIDAAIGCEGLIPARIERRELLREWLYLVEAATTEEAPVGPSVPFRDLRGRPLIIADPMLTRRLAEKLAAAAAGVGVELTIGSVLPSADLVKTLVEDGKGVTVMPFATVRRECMQRRLKARRITEPTLFRSAYLLTPEDAPLDPTVRRLITEVVADELCASPEYAVLVQPTLELA